MGGEAVTVEFGKGGDDITGESLDRTPSRSSF